MEGTQYLTVRSNVARDNTVNGFAGVGVEKAMFENNTAYANGYVGLTIISQPHDVVARGNHIYDNARGTVVQGDADAGLPSTGIAVEDNDIHDNADHGLKVAIVNDIAVSGNGIHGNDREGILLRGASNALVIGNALTDNAQADGVSELHIVAFEGIALSHDNLIFDNQATTELALTAGFYEKDASSYANNFTGNSVSATVTYEYLLEGTGSTYDPAPSGHVYQHAAEPTSRAPESWAAERTRPAAAPATTASMAKTATTR